MTNLEKRIKDLERRRPKPSKAVEEMSDKELEELISANTGIPVSELTDKRLEELIKAEESKIASGEGGKTP
jgi:ATP-dependent Clp protease ATP-binding subunit ClpA